jgi:hypothetical protein
MTWGFHGIMKINWRGVLAGVVLGALTGPAGRAAETPPPPAAVAEAMLGALVKGDYQTFVGAGTPELRQKLTLALFDKVTGDYAPRLKAGYELASLGCLRQAGCEVWLWRLRFTDGGDDVLMRLVMKNGHVAGLWLQ